jgi:myb proto-oncogene protein
MEFLGSLQQLETSAAGLRPHAKFSREEDETLRSLVEEMGPIDWMRIAQRMGGRNARQCKERWMNYLAPTLKKTVWTRDEDRILLQKHRELGPKWVQIARYFPDRTDAMVKNRFNRLRRREQKRLALFAYPDPAIMQMCQTAMFMRMPPQPRFVQAMPLPLLQPKIPARDVELAQADREAEEADLWSDDFTGVLECGFPEPFEFA